MLGSTFTFDASTSTDDVGITDYQWDFLADGSFEGSGVQYALTPTTAGTFDMRLQVMDADGNVDESVSSITVQPPANPGPFTLLVQINGPGQVDVAPLNETLPNANCDGDQCFLFGIAGGTELTLTASPFTPAAFQGWSAMECDNIPNPDTCTITLNSDREVSATFN